MNVSKNSFNRFDIKNVEDPGFVLKTGKKVTGISGFHGKLANIIGWIMEKIFHKTVGVKINEATFYFNCKSVVNWLNRVESSLDQNPKNPLNVNKAKTNLSERSHDATFVKNELERIVAFFKEQKAAKEKLSVENLEEAKKEENVDQALPEADSRISEEGDPQTETLPPVLSDELPPVPSAPPEKPVLSFPTKSSKDEEISEWCAQASPQMLLEKLEILMQDFSRRPFFKTEIFPQAFHRIFQCQTIDDEEIKKVLKGNIRMDIQVFAECVTSDLSLEKDEWKRLAICSDHPLTDGIFDAMRSKLQNPAFVFAFCPPSNGSSKPWDDLYKLWITKPLLIDEALKNYYQSPHYQENDIDLFIRFCRGSKEDQINEFKNLIIEKATPYQLIALSGNWHKDSQPKLLQDRLGELTLPTRLDVYHAALKGTKPYDARIADRAKSSIFELQTAKTEAEVEKVFTGLTKEQSVALFLAFAHDEWITQTTIRILLKDPEKFEVFCRELGCTINETFLAKIMPFHVLIRSGLLYTNLKPELRKPFVEYIKKKNNYFELFEVLLKQNSYDLAGEMLTFLDLDDEQLKTVGSGMKYHFDLKGMFTHYDLFKKLLLSILEEKGDDFYHSLNVKERAEVLNKENELAAAIVEKVPEEDLPNLLQKLENAPFLRFHIELLAAKNSEDKIINSLNEVVKNESIRSDYLANIIIFIGKNNNKVKEFLNSVAKARHNNPNLKDIFKDCFCRYRSYIKSKGIEVDNWTEILIDMIPTLSEDLLTELISIDKEGATFLQILTTKLSHENLSKVVKKLNIKDILNNHMPMREWKPQEFVNLFNVFDKDEDIQAFAYRFFSFWSPGKSDFYEACIKQPSQENDKIRDFKRFLELTEPTADVVNDVFPYATLEQKSFFRAYIQKNLKDRPRDFDKVKNL